jgi:hypothetical protein
MNAVPSAEAMPPVKTVKPMPATALLPPLMMGTQALPARAAGR